MPLTNITLGRCHACVHSFMHFEITATCKCSSTSERFHGSVCYFVPGDMNSLTIDFPHIISEMFHMLHFETVDICKDVPQVAQVNGSNISVSPCQVT